MAGLITWLNQNWLSLVQSIGIIGSLWLAGAAYRRDVKARRVGDLLTLADHHQKIWSDAHRRPELARIFRPEVDLVGEPVTLAEEEFLNVAFVHFYTSWLLVKEGSLLSINALTVDAHAFFELPVPQSVWEATKHRRDGEFVFFIEQALARSPRT